MRRRAFTLVEILIAIIVVAIVGSALFSALSSFLLSYGHTEDYTVAREEIEGAFQALSFQLGNAGLGMPNGRDGKGSFAMAFAAADGSAKPKASVMSLMGERGQSWGGPVTVAMGDISDAAMRVTSPGADGSYSGTNLYYAWAVPTGGLIDVVSTDSMAEPKLAVFSEPLTGVNNVFYFNVLSKDKGYWSGDKPRLKWVTGAEATLSNDVWIVFPSFGAPLWVEGSAGGAINTAVAPGSVKQKVLLGGALQGFEEAHRVRAARLRVVDGNLVRELYDAPPQELPSSTEVLARNVAGAWFRFNPGTRILQFTLAVNGLNNVEARHAAGRRPDGWPAEAPEIGDGKHRIVVESITWRVRN